jgi:hypothetical protein
MDDPGVSAKQLVKLAKKHIEDQQSRIVRQRELMAKYERDDDVARLSACSDDGGACSGRSAFV